MLEGGFQLFDFLRDGDAEHALVAAKADGCSEDTTLEIESQEIAEVLDTNGSVWTGILLWYCLLEKDLQRFPTASAES